ncbi:MAG: RES domain-containing protein [Rhodospirillales bacterium]|nr:RES domain-containing protein [Rhodospirillales bacterium]
MADAGEPQPRLTGGNAPVAPVAARTEFYRSHHADYGPVYSARARPTGSMTPRGVYGVLYAAHQVEGAFAETHLRKPGRRYVDRADMAQRRWSRLRTVRPLRLLPLHGRHLAQAGATAEVTHDLPRRWSSAAHAAGFDGIEYRSRYDDDQLCVALFERGDPAVVPSGPPNDWLSNPTVLARILDRYAVELG